MPEPEPEPEIYDPSLTTVFEAFGTMDTYIETTYTLYLYPITGNIDIDDLVAVFVEVVDKEEEYRGYNTIESVHNTNVLFASIVVRTSGNEKISSLKFFHYVNSTQGYVTSIDFTDKDFTLSIDGNNSDSFLHIEVFTDIQPEILQPEPEPEPEPELQNSLVTVFEAFGTMNTDIETTYTLYIYPITGNIDVDDLIVVFVTNIDGEEEYRGYNTVESVTLNDTDVLYSSIVVRTNGSHETISSLKVFHYVTSNKGYVTSIDVTDQTFTLPIDGNNSYVLFSLDIQPNISLPEIDSEPEPEPEINDLNLVTVVEAFGQMNTEIKTTYTLYLYPIIGDVTLGDLIAVFVDDEYRGHGIVVNGVVNNSNVLFTSIVVQTNGIHETISSLKVFHYVTSDKGYVTTIDLSFQIVLLPINGNNSNKWLGVTI